MHDVAATIGMTTGELARTMTEAELTQWAQYAQQRMLPQRRIELYLAQIAMLIFATNRPGAQHSLQDFMFDPIEHGAAKSKAEPPPESVAKAFNFKPRRLRGR